MRRWNGWGDDATRLPAPGERGPLPRPRSWGRPSRPSTRRSGTSWQPSRPVPGPARAPRRIPRCPRIPSSRPTRRTGSATPAARASPTGSPCGAAGWARARRRRAPRRRGRRARAPPLGGRVGRPGRPVRRRDERPRPARRPGRRAVRLDGPRADGRPQLVRRGERPRDVRARDGRTGRGGRPRGRRPHAGPLPAELGALHRRRLGRHAVGRPAVDRLRADRRAVRGRDRRGAGRAPGAPDAPGVGRRARTFASSSSARRGAWGSSPRRSSGPRRCPRRSGSTRSSSPTGTSAYAGVRELAGAELPLSMVRLSTPAETETNLALAGHEGTMKALRAYLGLRGAGRGRAMAVIGASGSHAVVSVALLEAFGILGRHGGRARAAGGGGVAQEPVPDPVPARRALVRRLRGGHARDRGRLVRRPAACSPASRR